MPALSEAVDRLARETGFSGVVRVDRSDDVELESAYGFADRRWGIPNAVDIRFGLASGTKGLTALTVMSLVEDGELELTTTARSLLGADLPLIDDAVTVEHLLAHRSGIGDYLDENDGLDVDDHSLPVPVHELATTEQYLTVLAGHPQQFAPGERFSYNNSGFVVLALIAERASGVPFPDLVRDRVSGPAGMVDTAFFRSDALPGRTAVGYVERAGEVRTNALHLPVRGSGDGGVFATTADVCALWRALFAGRIVPPTRVAEMVRARSDVPAESARYGLGFWVHEWRDHVVMLVGMDAGVSFRTAHDPQADLTYTVISNSTDGAWPITRLLDEQLLV